MTQPVGAYGESPYFDPARAGTNPDNEGLLAEPMPAGSDAIGAIYLMMSRDARTDAQGAMQDILNANEARRVAQERYLAALERQRQEEDDSSFWGDIAGTLGTVAKVAGCVAAVAFAVCTAGAGTPIAVLAISGAVASSASLAQSELGLFDGLMGEEAADRFGFWLGVGGAAASVGAAGLTYLGTDAAAQAAAASEVANTTKNAALVVGGVSGAAAGGAKLVQDYHRERAENHRADAAQARLDAQFQQFLINQLVAGLEETKERETANLKRIVAMNNLQDLAMTAAAQGVA
jgi:hypothetical protein